MNKTLIIEFMLKQALRKLWNTSKNMRKRLRWMLKSRIIFISNYDIRALFLNGYVKVANNFEVVSTVNSIEQGLINYQIENQNDFDVLSSINTGLKCDLLLSASISAATFDYVHELTLEQSSFEFYSNLSFNKIGLLKLNNISSSQIENVLSRVNSIKSLEIESCALSKLDLKHLTIESVIFESVTFSEAVKLPYLTGIQIDGDQLKFLICKGVTKVVLTNIFKMTDDSLKWIPTLRGLKQIWFECIFPEYLEYLPSSIRSFGFDNNSPAEFADEQKAKAKLPHLNKIEGCTSLRQLELLNLREIPENLVGTFTGQMTARPKRIVVTEENFYSLSNHPELFEKVKFLDVLEECFNFDWVPDKIEKLCISAVEIESLIVSRFQGK